jgi:hypothetical protein
MYAEPSPEQMAKVKAEKVDQKEFRAMVKKKKYNKTKEQLETVAFGKIQRGSGVIGWFFLADENFSHIYGRSAQKHAVFVKSISCTDQ